MTPVRQKQSFENYRDKTKTCTDTYWFILFSLVLCLFVAIAIISAINGDYLPIVNGYDSFGNACGAQNSKRFENISLSGTDTSNKPYLFYFSGDDPENSIKICTEQCIEEILFTPSELFAYGRAMRAKYCRYDYNMTQLRGNTGYMHIDRLGPCPSLNIAASTSIRNKCIPLNTLTDNWKAYSLLNSVGTVQLFFIYINLTWHYIAGLSGLAIVISIVLVVMMHLMRKIFAWLICVLGTITNGSLCGVLWYMYDDLPLKAPDEDYDQDEVEHIFLYMIHDFLINKQVILTLAVLASVLMFVSVFIIFCRRKEFSNLKDFFEEGVACLKHVPELMAIAMIDLIVLVLLLTFSVYVLLCLYTANYAEVKQFKNIEALKPGIINEYRSYQYVEYIEDRFLRSLFWPYFVSFLWILEFIFAIEKFLIGTTVSYWYFKRPVKSQLMNVVTVLLKYHLGTIAKGCIAESILKIPRMVVTSLNRKYKTCDCIDKWIRDANHNAYAVVGMEGIGFSPAAVIAYNTMKRNASDVEIANNAVDIVSFLCKLFVANVTCLIAVLILKNRTDLYFYMAPVILSTAIAFCISHVIVLLFEMTIDTLFLCNCEDKDTYGAGGQWSETNFAKLFRGKLSKQGPIHVYDIRSLERRPFRN